MDKLKALWAFLAALAHKLLDNTWMDNPVYHVQIAHALGGLVAILIAFMFWSMTGLLAVLAVGVAVIAAKEFWYDRVYEQPNDTLQGSAIDFMSYMIGAAVGVGLSLIKFYLLKG